MSIEISCIFVLFALLLLKTFYLKQRPPLLEHSVLALLSLGILPLRFLSQAGRQKRRRRRRPLVHPLFQTSGKRDARKAGNRREKKNTI